MSYEANGEQLTLWHVEPDAKDLLREFERFIATPEFATPGQESYQKTVTQWVIPAVGSTLYVSVEDPSFDSNRDKITNEDHVTIVYSCAGGWGEFDLHPDVAEGEVGTKLERSNPSSNSMEPERFLEELGLASASGLWAWLDSNIPSAAGVTITRSAAFTKVDRQPLPLSLELDSPAASTTISLKVTVRAEPGTYETDIEHAAHTLEVEQSPGMSFECYFINNAKELLDYKYRSGDGEKWRGITLEDLRSIELLMMQTIGYARRALAATVEVEGLGSPDDGEAQPAEAATVPLIRRAIGWLATWRAIFKK